MIKKKFIDLKMLFGIKNTFSVVSDNITNKVYQKVKLNSLYPGCGLHWFLWHQFPQSFSCTAGNFPPSFSPFFPLFLNFKGIQVSLEKRFGHVSPTMMNSSSTGKLSLTYCLIA